MNRLSTFCIATGGTLLFASASFADDRLTFVGEGTTLTGTNGGGSAAASWLHNFSPDELLGAGVQYQTIGDAHWTFGSITGAYVKGPADARWSLSGDVRRGSGWNGLRNFTYQDLTAGLSLPLVQGLSVQLEDRQIDIDTNHGNLPKIGLSYLLTPHLLTSVSYARSVGGNLGTRVTAARADYYLRAMHFIGGGAFGPVDPIVLNLGPSVHLPSRNLHEGYLGGGRTSSRSEWLLIGDYQKLGSSERVTVSLSYTIFLNGPTRGPVPVG